MAALLAVLIVFSEKVLASKASYFGFGPPPSYLSAVDAVQKARYDRFFTPEKRGELRISQPIALCRDRGSVRRDVCGYRVCVSILGHPPEEWWILQGFGVERLAEASFCRHDTLVGWQGDPPVQVEDFCKVQRHPECKNGAREGHSVLSLHESTGAAQLEREAAEKSRTQQEAAAEAQRISDAAAESARLEAERIAAKITIAVLRRAQLVEQAKSSGPLGGYPQLARNLYSECRSFADEVFVTENVERVDVVVFEDCGEASQEILNERVRAALRAAPPALREQIKDLHAYAIASLRALENYRQSIIEARQDRSARISQLDERVARIELDL